MYQILRTETFSRWLKKLRDRKAKARIITRIDAIRLGNLGDWKSIGSGVSEFRVHVGPGYRLYFTKQGEAIVLLLCGGAKASQSRDIDRAKRLLRDIEDEDDD